MWKKGSKIFSITQNKCPRCHKGDFFVKSAGFKFKNNLKMNEKCDHCGLKYMIEPSFFYGAMYVSYAITVAMAVAIFVLCQLFGFGLLTSVVSIVLALVIANPFVMRISRLLYINIFVKYSPDSSDLKEKTKA